MRIRAASLATALVVLGASWAQAAETDTMLVSAARDGKSTGYKADVAGISATGRHVLFSSRSPRIVRGDTNGARDVFVWDRQTGRSERVNVSSDGSQTTAAECHCHIGSQATAISDDGNVVLFTTRAPGLVRSDDSGSDAFVHDRRSGKTTLVSRDPDDSGGFPQALSPNGRFVIYKLYIPGTTEFDTLLYDRETKERTTIELPVREGHEFSKSVVEIANDGRSLTFVSSDPDLQSDSTMATGEQVYVFDIPTGDIEQASVSSGEQGANNNSGGGATSADGRYVAFDSVGNNLAPGQDLYGGQDVFLRDRVEGTTILVTVGNGGLPANGTSWARGVSDDGCRVAFESEASNLVEDDTNAVTDTFVRDLCAGSTTRVSVASDGAEGNGESYGGFLSADGLWATFGSTAANLSSADPDKKFDVFVRGPI
jgi:Tol biopolymer transport system component